MTTELEQDLHAWMTDLPAGETEFDEDWEPRRPEEAERLLRRLGRAEREAAEIMEFAKAEIAKISAWQDDRLAGPMRLAAEARAALDGYARAVNGWDNQAGRVLNLPSGTLRLTAPKDSLVVDDDRAAAAWLAVNMADAARLTVVPANLKTLTNVGKPEPLDEDRVTCPVLTDDGEVVPGVHYERPVRPTFTARPK